MKPSDVPAGPVLIDTDVFSYLMWSRGPWKDFAALVNGHPFVLSFANVGELRAGAMKAIASGAWRPDRLLRLNKRIAECVILPATNAVVDIYAELHAQCRDKLKKDGANDMWLAACALAQTPNLPIATNNLADYQTLSAVRPITLIHPNV